MTRKFAILVLWMISIPLVIVAGAAALFPMALLDGRFDCCLAATMFCSVGVWWLLDDLPHAVAQLYPGRPKETERLATTSRLFTLQLTWSLGVLVATTADRGEFSNSLTILVNIVVSLIWLRMWLIDLRDLFQEQLTIEQKLDEALA